MTTKFILILGGYGSTGLPLAKLLLAHTDVSIVLTGRSLEKARQATSQLNSEFAGERVSSKAVDASDPHSLREAFKGMNMVVVTSSTSEHVELVARAALKAKMDYLDVQVGTSKIKLLQSLAGEIEQAGLCFITDGGFHPGLPAAMVHLVGKQIDQLTSANVGSVIKIDWNTLNLSEATMEEFAGEFNNFQTLHFKDGRWQKADALTMMIPRFMDFGGQFGRQYCVPMFLEEMRSLPEHYPALKETGFFVGGFNWFVDWFLMPLIMLALKLFPRAGLRLMGRLLFWGLKTFSRPPYRTILKIEARGTKKGVEKTMDISISHEDGYALTAIPVAACLLQILDGSSRRAGLWLQAHIVEPKRFFENMEMMGVELKVAES